MQEFDRNTWERLFRLAKPFFFSDAKWKARAVLMLLVVLSVSVSGFNAMMSFIERDFMTALSLKESDDYYHHITRYLIAIIGATVLGVMFRYTEERLGLMWRRWLSHHILEKYFARRSYYKLGAYEGIDNPDQRLEEDIRSFSVTCLSFLLIVLNSLIQLFTFMGILWSISSTLSFAVVGYAVGGSVLTYLLGKPLIHLNFAQLRKEADYRYKLITIRENAESIAFYRGEKKEFQRVRQRLKHALRNLRTIINWNRNLGFFTTAYNRFSTIFPIVIVAPLYLRGQIEFGVVTQSVSAFANALGALSIIVANFGSISSFAAVVRRLGTFVEAVADTHEKEFAPSDLTIVIENSPKICFEHVTIVTPQMKKTLIRDLSFCLSGQSVLITGPSGSGKSSIFRVLSGLWNSGSGTITRPPIEQCFFLPQRSYMVLGTLRSQLLYGGQGKIYTDGELTTLLESIGLEALLKRVGGLDVVMDWPNTLSTGEQQTLGFARMLLAKPRYAFLDESTTALDAEMEARLYDKLRELTTAYFTIGYSSTLIKQHQVLLRLLGNSQWELKEI